MKKIQCLPVSLFVVMFGLITLVAAPAAARRGVNSWTSLGELHVSDRVERDTLHLKSRKGTFDSIRLKVQRHAVQFRSLKVQFENDTVQDVSLSSVIRAGKFTRVIDLEGGQRAIKKIVFVYDAQTRRRGKGAKIHVYGRR